MGKDDWDYWDEILDFVTGEGAFLLPLNYPLANTASTENCPRNVDLYWEILLPLGIEFRTVNDQGMLPFTIGLIFSFPYQALKTITGQFSEFDFVILDGRKCFRPIRFYAVDSLVPLDGSSNESFRGFCHAHL